jgi:hypothetical protein
VLSDAEHHIILGFDPGGRSGVALLRAGGGQPCSCDWGTVNSVDEGLLWFASRLGADAPAAIGIDTPLCWQTGACGWRGPDNWLRARYPAVSGSVISTNSAYGAMVVQGPALGRLIRCRFQATTVRLNETHPKVLYHALTGQPYPRAEPMTPEAVAWLCERLSISPSACR